MNKNWINYEFSKQAEKELLEFMKLADSERNNAFCDPEKYEVYKKSLGLDFGESKLKDTVETVDLTENDEIIEEHIINTTTENLQMITCQDVTESIKEHLESSENIPSSLFSTIQIYPQESIKDIFNSLSELSTEHILVVGESIMNHCTNEIILEYFSSCILFKKMLEVFEEDLRSLFLSLCEKSNKIMISQVVAIIHVEEELDSLLLYLSFTRNDVKEGILRELMREYEVCTKKYVKVFDSLIFEEIDHDCLKQVVEVLAHNSEQYAMDKDYGKLLIKIFQLMGDDLIQVKNSLRHILTNHKSVWKSKLQKMCSTCFETSLLSFTLQ